MMTSLLLYRDRGHGNSGRILNEDEGARIRAGADGSVGLGDPQFHPALTWANHVGQQVRYLQGVLDAQCVVRVKLPKRFIEFGVLEPGRTRVEETFGRTRFYPSFSYLADDDLVADRERLTAPEIEHLLAVVRKTRSRDLSPEHATTIVAWAQAVATKGAALRLLLNSEARVRIGEDYPFTVEVTSATRQTLPAEWRLPAPAKP